MSVLGVIVCAIVGFAVGIGIWQTHVYHFLGWLRGYEYHYWQTYGGPLPRGWDGQGFVTDGIDPDDFDKGWKDFGIKQ